MATNSEKLAKILKDFEVHHQNGLQMAHRLGEALRQSATLDSLKAHVELDKTLGCVAETVEKRLLPAVRNCMKFSEPMVPKASDDPRKHGHRRREIPRYNKRLPVRFAKPGAAGFQKAYSRDVGAKGLFILANRVEQPGQQLNIEVDVPDVGSVQLVGEVVWTKWSPPSLRAVEYPGFGVKISNAPESWYNFFLRDAAKLSHFGHSA